MGKYPGPYFDAGALRTAIISQVPSLASIRALADALNACAATVSDNAMGCAA